MIDKGILDFIWSQKINRAILLSDVLVVILGLAVKFFIWNELPLLPFIFYGSAIAFGLIWTNILPSRNHSEWLRAINKLTVGFELKKDKRVYIKNFWPWTEATKIKNIVRSIEIPYYDFNRADVLESKDLLVIYGRNEGLLGTIGMTNRARPFGINLTNQSLIGADQLYQVDLISRHDAKEFCELTFIDKLYGKENPITIRIYNDGQ